MIYVIELDCCFIYIKMMIGNVEFVILEDFVVKVELKSNFGLLFYELMDVEMLKEKNDII